MIIQLGGFQTFFFNPHNPLLTGSSVEIQRMTYSAAVIEEDSEGVEISPISHPAPSLLVLRFASPFLG